MSPLRLQLGPLIPTGTRLPAIDELRGLAILLVVIYHICGTLHLPNTLHGEIGVDLFLIVSGFSLALSAVDQPVGQFLKRRFIRIFPAYWLALGGYLWLHHHFFGSAYSGANIALHIVGLHAFGPGEFFAAICDSFWFISMIVPAYLLFLAIRRQLGNLSVIVCLTGLLTATACVVYQTFHHSGGVNYLGVRIPSFFIGLVAGRLINTGTMELRFNLPLAIGLFSFYYLIFVRGISFVYPIYALAIIATWLAVRPWLGKISPGRDLLTVLSGLGLISYEIYLFHQPLMREYNLYVLNTHLHLAQPTTLHLALGILVSLFLTLSIARAVHALSERLFRRRHQTRTAPSSDPTPS